ncbi:hypothetical protein Tco_1327511 [Tanacetum coccineum]
MKEQAYNIIKTKDSRTQRQSNLNKFKEARFKILPQELKDHTLGEIVSLKYVYEHGSSEFVGYLHKETSLQGRFSMQIYWASMFILPVSIANDVERLMRDFLWNFGEFKRGKAKVKWSDVCRPKLEGGLGRSFWDIPDKGVSSWNWKKILIIRGLIRDHIIHRVGDGTKTSLWFDNWHPICPFSNFISNWKIQYAGLSLKTKVADVVDNGKWIWLKFLSDEFYGLTAISPPSLINGKNDKVLWKTNS